MISNAHSVFNFDLGETADAIRDWSAISHPTKSHRAQLKLTRAISSRSICGPSSVLSAFMASLSRKNMAASGLDTSSTVLHLKKSPALRHRSACPTARIQTLCVNQICCNGNEAQKRKYLPQADLRRTCRCAGDVRTRCWARMSCR